MDQISFYSCSDDPRTINKTIQNELPIEANVYGEINLTQPSFLVEYNSALFSKNYFYWPLVNRYYYITQIGGNKGERLLISGRVDCLMSFKSQIENLTCVIDRAGSNRSKWLDDNIYPLEATTQVQNYEFNSTPFSTASSGTHYVLTTLGNSVAPPQPAQPSS